MSLEQCIKVWVMELAVSLRNAESTAGDKCSVGDESPGNENIYVKRYVP